MQKLNITSIILDNESKYKRTKIVDHKKSRKVLTIHGKTTISGLI